MKKLMLWMATLLFFAIRLTACPTCIGRLSEGDPAFFHDEFYQRKLYDIENDSRVITEDEYFEDEDDENDKEIN